MGEMEEPKIFARQHQQSRAHPREEFIGPATRESGSMDALVQGTEQEAEHDPVQDQRGREPQAAATCPQQKSARAQRPRMERELQQAVRIRAARKSSHSLAVEATYRNCIDIHVCPYSASTRRIPACTPRSASGGTRPTRDVSIRLSTVINCATFTTESRARPLALRLSRRFPGAAARRKFEVSTAQIIVLIALSLKSFDCTTRTGRRRPDPAGSPSAAHQTSPRRTTIPRRELGRAGSCWSAIRTLNRAVHGRRRVAHS